MGDAPVLRPDPERLLPLMLALAFTTGLIDAVSVLGLGKVFTANMTGNVVFLGLAIAGAHNFIPSLYITALVAFMAGAVFAGRIGNKADARPLRRWLVMSASAEATLLWAAAWVAFGYTISETVRLSGYVIIALTALAMGLRNATIRQLKIADMTTTVLTMTITGLAADSRLAGGANPNIGRRTASVAAIFAGAALGAVLVLGPGLSSALFLAGALALGTTLLCASRRP